MSHSPLSALAQADQNNPQDETFDAAADDLKDPIQVSPGAAGAEALRDWDEDYKQGWIAINRLMRSGWSWSGNEAHNAFLNLGPDVDGSPRFVDASKAIGFDSVSDGRAAVRMDLDFDGDLDLLVTSRDGPRLRVLRNDLVGAKRFVALRLVGNAGNPTGIGARIEVRVAGKDAKPVVRSVRAGEGFLSQQPGWVHFGLGKLAEKESSLPGTDAATPAASLEVSVRWPDGNSETFAGVYPGDWALLAHGEGQAQVWTPPGLGSGLVAGEVQSPTSTGRARIVLPEPLPLPSLDLVAADGTETSIFGIQVGGAGRGTGRPLLLNLWSATCTPCIAELKELSAEAGNFGRLGILALCIDEGEQAEAAAKLLARLNWPFPAAYAPPDTRATISVLLEALLDKEQPLAIPLSLLVNAKGELVCVYFGRLQPARLLADLTLLETDLGTRAYAATPFEGIWYKAPVLPSAAAFEGRLRSRGLERQAQDFGRSRIELSEDAEGSVLYSMARAAMNESASLQDSPASTAGALTVEDQAQLAEIVSLLQRAVKADPTLFGAQADLGVALHRLGRYALAVDAYSAALLLREDTGVRAKRGLTYVQLGRFDLAEREVQALRDRGAPQAESLATELERARQR